MDLREIECKDVKCIHLVQDGDQQKTLMNTVMNCWVSQKQGIS